MSTRSGGEDTRIHGKREGKERQDEDKDGKEGNSIREVGERRRNVMGKEMVGKKLRKGEEEEGQ